MDRNKPSQEEEKQISSADVDGGWAWIVLIAMFWWNVLMGGLLKTLGIFYVEYLELYDQGPTKTAWVMSGFSITFILPGLVTGFLSDLYNTRKVNIVLALLCSLSFAAAAFAPNLLITIVTQGLLAGFFAGTIDAPYIGIFNKYFVRKRDFANSLAFAGSSFGGLSLPYLLTWSIEKYTVRGTMLIFAGLWIQSVVIGAVLRPVDVSQGGVKQESNDLRYQSSGVSTTQKPTVWTIEDATQIPNSQKSSRRLRESSRITVLLGNLREYKYMLRRIPLLLVMGATFLNAICFYGQLGIWPVHVEANGMTKAEAALLLSISGLTEMATRPLVGYLCTRFRLNKPVLVAVFGFVTAGLGFPVTFTTRKWIWCLFAGLFGIFGGIFMPLSPPMLVNIAGRQKSGTVSALFLCCLGLGTTVGPLMLAALKEATGLYVSPIRLCLLLYIPAGVLLILSTLTDSWCLPDDRERKLSHQTETTRL